MSEELDENAINQRAKQRYLVTEIIERGYD